MNAMMAAARGGHEACVRALVAAGAQVTDCTCMCMTPLHFAALAGSRSIVKRLVTAGARVDARNARGATALMLAAEEGFCAVVEELLHSGADPSLTDQYGCSMVCIAERKGNRSALRALWHAVPAAVVNCSQKQSSEAKETDALMETEGDEQRPCTPPLHKASKSWECPSPESVKVRKEEEEDPIDQVLFAHVDVLLMS
jgi:hypothetical protein